MTWHSQSLVSWANLAVFVALVGYTLPAFVRVLSGRVSRYLDPIKSALLMLALNRSFYAIASVVTPFPHDEAGFQARVALGAFSFICGIGTLYVLRLYERRGS